MGVRVGVANFFGVNRIDRIDETNTFQLTFLSSMKIVGATGLGGLWAWYIRVANLRCVQGYGVKV